MDFKKTREHLGLTQVDVSKAVGVSVVSYRLWENGGGKPNEKNLKKLKKVLGLECKLVISK